jgi:hypothetical protein
MNSPEKKQYIRKLGTLFWYIPENKKEEISHEVLVESILNYGDKDAVIQLFQLLGLKNVAEIFEKSINLSERQRGNYYELTINYFTHFFRKYAH